MRIYWRLSAIVLAAMPVTPLLAQSANTTGTASIVEEFAITKDTDLAFGSVLPPTSGTNTVVISPSANSRSLTGGGNAVLIGGGSSRATYMIEGDGGQAFAVTLPANFIMTRSGGTEQITVTLVPLAAGGTLSGTTGVAGSAPFSVGGNFPVSNSTVVGAYSGNFTVSVDNN